MTKGIVEEKYNYIYHMIRDVVQINNLKLKSEHKSILFCLESRGKKIFPSHEILAQNCGLGETKLKRTLNELRSHDIINWTQVKGSSNRYRINRQAIATAYASYTFDQVQRDAKVVEEWESFYPDWEIAGVTN
jgi:hypothetical protein